jgi:hypothetical protein
VSVVDQQAPTVTCPAADITESAAANACQHAVSATVTAADNCDGDLTSQVTCVDQNNAAVTLASHSYPLGETTVTCGVADVAGNEGLVAAHSFFLSVLYVLTMINGCFCR